MNLLAWSLANPAGLWLFALALPLVLLFLLKRKRQLRSIPSTMLWSRALEDQLARSPFRRPTEWLSLVLLLLALLAATLGLARLRGGRATEGGMHRIVVLDVSASMGTKEEGGSRFDAALEAVRGVIEGVAEGDTVTLISASDPPRVLAQDANDEAVLNKVVDSLGLVLTGEGLELGFDLATQFAERSDDGRPFEILVLSDFAVKEETRRRLSIHSNGQRVRLIPCGSPSQNAGIVHAALSRHEQQDLLVLSVLGNQKATGTRTVTLARDDQIIDATEITLNGDELVPMTFRIPTSDSAAPVRYTARLEPSDAFALDDVVFVGASPRNEASVLVIGDEDPFTSRLPEVFVGLSLDRASAAEGSTASYDLAIVTSPLATSAPLNARRQLYVGVIPDLAGVSDTGELADPPVLDWDRESPWLRDVGLSNLQVARARRLTLPDTAQILVRVEGGAQLATLSTGRDRDVFLWASGLYDSNLALMPALPLLIRNLLGDALLGLEVRTQRARDPLRFRPSLKNAEGDVTLTIKSPKGRSQESTLWARGELPFNEAPELGFYEVTTQKGAESDRTALGVSLLDERETSLMPEAPKPPDGSETTTVESLTSFTTQRAFWPWLTGAAALLLLLELFVRSGVFQRKP